MFGRALKRGSSAGEMLLGSSAISRPRTRPGPGWRRVVRPKPRREDLKRSVCLGCTHPFAPSPRGAEPAGVRRSAAFSSHCVIDPASGLSARSSRYALLHNVSGMRSWRSRWIVLVQPLGFARFLYLALSWPLARRRRSRRSPRTGCGRGTVWHGLFVWLVSGLG